MGIYIKQTDGLQRLSGEKLTYQKIVSALGYVPFKGNYNDLTNKPITQDGNDSVFIIQDAQGNKIAQIDESGLTVTKVYTNDVYAGGDSLLAKLTQALNNIQDVQTKVAALPISEYENSSYLSIQDSYGNPIAQFDESGLTIFAVKTNKVEIGTTNVETKLQEMQGTLDSITQDVVTEKTLEEAIDDAVAALPIKQTSSGTSITTTDAEANFTIQDKDGNISIQVDENGTITHKVLTHEVEIRPIGKNAYDVTTRFEAVEAATGNVQSISDATIQSLVSAAFASK